MPTPHLEVQEQCLWKRCLKAGQQRQELLKRLPCSCDLSFVCGVRAFERINVFCVQTILYLAVFHIFMKDTNFIILYFSDFFSLQYICKKFLFSTSTSQNICIAPIAYRLKRFTKSV